MKENEELAIRRRLEQEEAARDRTKYSYAYDALPHLMTWNESHEVVVRVIEGKADYDSLPCDEENEISKGMNFKDQTEIIRANGNSEPLCEALGMQPCKKTECPLYIDAGTKDTEGRVITQVPICREFKLAFRKQPTSK